MQEKFFALHIKFILELNDPFFTFWFQFSSLTILHIFGI